MKIKYDIGDNFYKYLNIALGIYTSKKSLQKNPNKKIRSYTRTGLYYTCMALLLWIAGTILFTIHHNRIFLEIFSSIMGALGIVIITYYIVFIITYFSNRKKVHSGILTISKEIITDVSNDNLSIQFGWDKVEFIVVTDDELVIVSNFQWYLFADIENKKEIVEGIKKCNKDVILIEK